MSSASQEHQPTLDSVAPRFLVGDMEQALAFYGQLGFATPYHDLIITHKFLEPPAERIAKAEIIRGLFNTTWLVTMARKSVPKDVGNDKS